MQSLGEAPTSAGIPVHPRENYPQCSRCPYVLGKAAHTSGSGIAVIGSVTHRNRNAHGTLGQVTHVTRNARIASRRASHRSMRSPHDQWDNLPRQPGMSLSPTRLLGCPPMPGSSLGWPPTEARAPGFPPAPACRMGCPPTPVPSLGWLPTPGGAQSIPRGATQTRSTPTKAPVACGTAAHGSPGQHWDGHPRHSPPPKKAQLTALQEFACRPRASPPRLYKLSAPNGLKRPSNGTDPASPQPHIPSEPLYLVPAKSSRYQSTSLGHKVAFKAKKALLNLLRIATVLEKVLVEGL